MNKCLVLTVRFLGDRYHGRTQNGREPEWPPSPLRLFQAIVAGVAPRWVDVGIRDREVAALEWFQGLGPPRIVAPVSQPGRPLLNYVRENLSDIAPDKRDAKFARPTLFLGHPVVKYSWAFHVCDYAKAEIITHCARHCHSLGWGIDLVVGNGEITEAESEGDIGEAWYPEPNPTAGASILRVPRASTDEASASTLAELFDRYLHSLKRIASARNPVPPLTAFAVVGYRRATDAAGRPFAAFQLLTPETAELDRHVRPRPRQWQEPAGGRRGGRSCILQPPLSSRSRHPPGPLVGVPMLAFCSRLCRAGRVARTSRRSERRAPRGRGGPGRSNAVVARTSRRSERRAPDGSPTSRYRPSVRKAWSARSTAS
jgi:CRISPR-associated protein Csb2